jgi:hypothetical protein
MAVVYKFLGRREQAGQLIGYLAGPVFAAGADNGGAMPAGVYAACPEQVETGFRKELGTWSGQWLYPRRVHLGAACWYLFAELDVNPYWLRVFPKSP